jgi:hypothetical protein
VSLWFQRKFLVDTQLDFEGWKTVLELSTMWRMRALREHCITRMSPLPDSITNLEKVLMARKHMALEWLVEGYKGLVTTSSSSDFISDNEVEQLGSSTALQLFRIKIRSMKYKELDVERELRRDIRSTFWSELERLDEYDMDSQEVGIKN